MAIPVSLDDAKQHLRLELDDDTQNDLVLGWIADAAGWVENYTGHILEARDVTESFVGFDAPQLKAWPIKPAAVPVLTYEASGGAIVPITDVRISLVRRPARVVPWVGSRWPSLPVAPPVNVTVRAGYEAGDIVPGNFRRAMLMLIGAYDADREGGDVLAKAEKTAKSICRPYRLMSL